MSNDTRESVAANAAAWVLIHGSDDDDDAETHTPVIAAEETADLARHIARRVLRHVDSLEPEGHVIVPITELEELRTQMDDHGVGYLGRMRGAAENLLARIPEPPDPALEIVTNYLANAQGNCAEPKATDIVFYLRQAGLLPEVDS